MRSVVYLFVVLIGAAVGIAGYFGLAFTPIEAALAGLVTVCLALIVLERTLRRRAVGRLERSVQDLSRLLSTDAQAGQALNQRLNRLEDMEPKQRLEVMEADVSVLGTVVRQLAETVADLEEAENRRGGAVGPARPEADKDEPTDPPDTAAAPAVPLEALGRALEEGRLVYHVQPIVTLPQRRTHGYDVIPRLVREDGEFIDPADFWPDEAGADLVRRIELGALREAIALVRRARTAGKPAALYLPLSATTLIDDSTAEAFKGLLSANEAIGDLVSFRISEADWNEVHGARDSALATVATHGAGFSLTGVSSLRLNFSSLTGLGVRSVRAEAQRFIDNPASYTDFHTADIAAYLGRFEIELIITGVGSEQHILTLLDDGIGLVQGSHISGPGPIRSELMLDPDAAAHQ